VKRGVILIAVVVAAVIPAAASRAAARPPASLRADIAEWSVVPSTGVVRSGLVRITARNLGLERHQLMLVRTARFAKGLTLAGNHASARAAARPLVVAPGGAASIVAWLPPGNYLLIDNLPWHYWHGTFAAIVVR
jgi:uncharacterized cupredoxin-like copper-binding protein